jgi:putative radical SAM enzyme (TIGR03279 family)
MVKIISVAAHSRAARAGVCAGDVLHTINGRDINDVLDYRFHLANRTVTLCVGRDGQMLEFSITKGEYDDIGLEFETPLMDEKHACENRCIFCFIDQLPKGLRQTLYFKDDDSRLSFLHGNYVTLTNLSQRDIERIIEMHISPINVSVHTTDPELRVRMMRNKHAGEVLSYLRLLADAGIRICAQVVLCRGINDGDALSRTMRDLLAYMPALDSVSIVPAGLTRYRQKLYPLEPYTPESAAP